MAYPAYPPAGPFPPGGQPRLDTQPPDSVRRAVYLMYAGAAVSVVALIVGAVTGKVVAYSYSTVNGQTRMHQNPVAGVIVAAIILAVLWLWMAWKNYRGRGWARVLSTVFFGFMCLIMLVNLAGLPSAYAFLVILMWIVGLVATIYLHKGESRQYYAAVKASRGYGVVPPPVYPPPGYPPQQPPAPGYGQPGQPPADFGQPPGNPQQ